MILWYFYVRLWFTGRNKFIKSNKKSNVTVNSLIIITVVIAIISGVILSVIRIIINTATAISVSLSLYHWNYSYHSLNRSIITRRKSLYTGSVVWTRYTIYYYYFFNHHSHSDFLEISVRLFSPFLASRKINFNYCNIFTYICTLSSWACVLGVSVLCLIWDTFINQPCSLQELSPVIWGNALSWKFWLLCARPDPINIH